MSRGTRREAIATLLLVVLVWGGAVPASAQEPADPSLIEQVIARIEAMSPTFGSTGTVAVTVIRLDTKQTASFHGDAVVKSGSSNKAIWMAAALYRRDLAAVEPIARSALWSSSNDAAGRAIDLAGGIDRVNRFASDLGLRRTVAYEWNFGTKRVSRYYPGPLRGNNLTTTDDLARFWELVAIGWAVQGAERTAFLDWTAGPKQDFEGERMIARLPDPVGAESSFKMGWLPAGRVYVLQEDEFGPNGEQPGEEIVLDEDSVIIGGGIIRVPGGPSYVIALASYDGENWVAMTSWVEYVSCVVYSVMAGDASDCVRDRDPPRIRERRAVPVGELREVAVRPGSFTVSGWASDPDAWWGPSPVAITVDGIVVGTGAAIPATPDELSAPPFDRTLVFRGVTGTHEVCVTAVNDGVGASTAIGCRTVDLVAMEPRDPPVAVE